MIRYRINNILFVMNIQGRRDHRRLKLSVGDIYLETRKAKFEPIHPVHKTQASDPFLSYKESCKLKSIQTNSPPSDPSSETIQMISKNDFGHCKADRTGTRCNQNCVQKRLLAMTSRVISFEYFRRDAERAVQHVAGWQQRFNDKEPPRCQISNWLREGGDKEV
jgi:hypothetical protein